MTPERPLHLLCEGALHWSLGGEYALLALRRALDAGAAISLEFVGDGPDRERLVFAAHDLELEDCVRFLDGTSGWAHAEVLVLPALVDGAWPVASRASREGLAIVCSDLPQLRRVVRDGLNGLRVPARDAEALAEALLSLAADPERLHRLRRNRGAR